MAKRNIELELRAQVNSREYDKLLKKQLSTKIF